jgi:DMSO/TMAO reductase YedYZ molybdopterin-dependent catalytic subunit
MRKHKGLSTVLTIAGTAILLITSCSSPAATSVSQLPGVEVKQYNGEKLTAINSMGFNGINGVQNIDKNTYHLEVIGLVTNPGNYTYDQILSDFASYQKVVSIDCVEGWSAKILWEGVQVRDIIAKAGPLDTAKVVIFHAADGYTTSFPIEWIMNNPIIIADKMNGVDIPAKYGAPFRLAAEMKWGYKWCKWVTGIELSDDINYQGYWEERGYNNNGDVNGSMYGN